MKINNILLLGVSLLMLLAPLAVSRPASNEQVVISATADAVDSLYRDIVPRDLNIINSDSGLARLVSMGIAEGMRGKFDRIMLNSGQDSSALRLFFDILGFEMSYSKGSSRGFLRGRNLKRELQCDFRINIRNGEVLRDTRNLSVRFADEIGRSDVSFVNSRIIPELAPQAPGSGWSRYAEPGIVVASVGTLVYLFFANR